MVGAVVGILGSLYSGISSYKSSKKAEKLQKQEAALLYEEAERDSVKVYEEAVSFASEQKMAFLSNGVEASGTASDVVLQTIAWGREEADAILKQGRARRDLGLTEAKLTRSTGKAQMIGSFLQAGGQATSAYGSAKLSAAQSGVR